MGEVTAKCAVGNDSIEEKMGAVKERGAEHGQGEGPGGWMGIFQIPGWLPFFLFLRVGSR